MLGAGGGARPCLLLLAVWIYFWCTAKQELPGNLAHMLGGKREDVAVSCFPLGESMEAVLITKRLVLPENPLKSKVAGAHRSQSICCLTAQCGVIWDSLTDLVTMCRY